MLEGWKEEKNMEAINAALRVTRASKVKGKRESVRCGRDELDEPQRS